MHQPHDTTLSLTQTHQINVTHKITASHLHTFSHIYSCTLSHTHISVSHRHTKVTAFPLTLSGLKPEAPQIAIITSLPLCRSPGSLLHVVKLSLPEVCAPPLPPEEDNQKTESDHP